MRSNAVLLSCFTCGEVDPMSHRAWQCQCGRAQRRKMTPEEAAEYRRKYPAAPPEDDR